MPSRGKSKPSNEVLRYTINKRSSSTVKAHYLRWRSEQDPPLPPRCDNPDCFFHDNPLMWNGKPFKPVVDHINGVNSDNRPKNLRLLCPNCDSQLPTRGGGNKGRIKKDTGGFAEDLRDGRVKYELPVEPGIFVSSGQNVELEVTNNAVRKTRNKQ